MNIDEKLFGNGFFETSLNSEHKGKLVENFGWSPFSVLNTCDAAWLARKKAWISLGLQGETGRRIDDTSDKTSIAYRKTLNGFGNGLRKAYRLKELGLIDASGDYDYDTETKTGTSVFDPVLTELMLKWFSKPDDAYLDCFAGGSTRGIVSSLCNRKYVGVEVRPEQVEANNDQAKLILDGSTPEPRWILGDSTKLTNLLQQDYKKKLFDFSMLCPPYYNTEVYSSDAKDGSTHKTYEEFLFWYADILEQMYNHLKENSWFVLIVSEVRNKKTGEFYNFVGDNTTICKEIGFHYWNELILLNSRASNALRINRPFSQTRKIGRCHQNILVFWKGDVANIRDNFNTPIGEMN